MSFFINKSSVKFIAGINNAEAWHKWKSDREEMIGLCVTGRSNVGKSSLINKLFGNKTARTSKTPGRTREINVFTFQLEQDGKPWPESPTFYLFDLPGYGFAQVHAQMKNDWDQMMDTFFSEMPAGTMVINIQDARHPGTDKDFEFYKYLKKHPFFALMVFNKVDKLKTQKERLDFEKEKVALSKKFKWYKQMHSVSAEKGNNIPALQDGICSSLLKKFSLDESGQ